MSLQKHDIAIPLLTVLVAAAGSYLTFQGLDWYGQLRLPSFAPDGRNIGFIWTIIYALATLSALWFYKAPRQRFFHVIVILFLTNALFNVFWSFLFFVLHDFAAALVEMLILNLLNLKLIYFLWDYERKSALLLVPYFLWVAVATYLTYLIAALNG